MVPSLTRAFKGLANITPRLLLRLAHDLVEDPRCLVSRYAFIGATPTLYIGVLWSSSHTAQRVKRR